MTLKVHKSAVPSSPVTWFGSDRDRLYGFNPLLGVRSCLRHACDRRWRAEVGHASTAPTRRSAFTWLPTKSCYRVSPDLPGLTGARSAGFRKGSAGFRETASVRFRRYHIRNSSERMEFTMSSRAGARGIRLL
uniref:Uncharacterized protein n=1 Tax=Branchiostoma floridae TaxID=7739 RepID=C3YR38_BRAFL|eukprot:XP_002601268.1 hypothetical protein BRAFLDRAFT_95045 [Branchiostoma floridae]